MGRSTGGYAMKPGARRLTDDRARAESAEGRPNREQRRAMERLRRKEGRK